MLAELELALLQILNLLHVQYLQISTTVMAVTRIIVLMIRITVLTMDQISVISIERQPSVSYEDN